MNNYNISKKTFAQIDLNDPFFQSLKDDYPSFEGWFEGKKGENAFVQYDDSKKIVGFLFLKIEENIVDDITPNIIAGKILKVGTFKINAHGTKMGEQFIKIIMDYALYENVDVCYVTIFAKHKSLIDLVERFGFHYYGSKGAGEAKESVYLKNMRKSEDDIIIDYPRISFSKARKYILSIYPKYHSIMFPDSILTTENKNIIRDVSYTNSIHKVYVCSMEGVDSLKYGDILLIYRTAEEGRPAEYTAVASSICVVEEVKNQTEFDSFDSFYEYASQYSVFDRNDLKYWYNKGRCRAIKFTYNVPLKKRIVRHDLIENIGLSRDVYWGFFSLSNEEFLKIVDAGEVNKLIFM